MEFRSWRDLLAAGRARVCVQDDGVRSVIVFGDVDAEVVTDVHLYIDAGHREVRIRDLDGYLVLSEAYRY